MDNITLIQKEMVEKLLRDVEFTQRIDTMSNEQLISEVLNKVWAKMEIGTWEINLLEALIERVRGLDNIPGKESGGRSEYYGNQMEKCLQTDFVAGRKTGDNN